MGAPCQHKIAHGIELYIKAVNSSYFNRHTRIRTDSVRVNKIFGSIK